MKQGIRTVVFIVILQGLVAGVSGFPEVGIALEITPGDHIWYPTNTSRIGIGTHEVKWTVPSPANIWLYCNGTLVKHIVKHERINETYQIYQWRISKADIDEWGSGTGYFLRFVREPWPDHGPYPGDETHSQEFRIEAYRDNEGYEQVMAGEHVFLFDNVNHGESYNISYSFKHDIGEGNKLKLWIVSRSSEETRYVQELKDTEGSHVFKPDKTEPIGIIVTLEGGELNDSNWVKVTCTLLSEEENVVSGYPMLFLMVSLMTCLVLKLLTFKRKK